MEKADYKHRAAAGCGRCFGAAHPQGDAGIRLRAAAAAVTPGVAVPGGMDRIIYPHGRRVLYGVGNAAAG